MPTTWTNQTRPGKGWVYNQPELLYNSTKDPLTDQDVFYNTEGTDTSWTNEAKP